ncbi:MAG: GNAT family N-acetyltransferase [Patescibacteria group bacterium]|nr:GNAT family N-acetyltransferase [Patescibacteria group bacterium]
MDLKLERLTEDKFQDWNNFCLKSNDAWFWHTADWLNYTRHYRLDLKTQDFSFLVYKQDQIMAIVPLTLEFYPDKNVKEFSFGGWAIPAPALKNSISSEERKIIFESIFSKIDELARQEKASLSRFVYSPLSDNYLNKKISPDIFLDFGYIDISVSSQIIDLRKTQDELWKNLRRNHRRSILKNSRSKVGFFTSQNLTDDVFRAYQEMHRRAAGRKTRPGITFELMRDWLRKGFAFLAVVEFDGKKIGFEYYSIYKNQVYAFSAANDPNYEKMPIRHFLEWESILWMKKQKFSFYEIGHQPYWSPSQKQLNIAHFKEGFGGLIMPLFMREKSYN